MRVIGVQKRLGKMMGQSRDKVLFVPITFLMKVLSSDRGLAILVRPEGHGGARPRRGRGPDHPPLGAQDPIQGRRPFGVVGSRAVQAVWRSISQGAYLATIIVSGMSLVVGAIVIANIMFVSVVERTREIGLRKALGARSKDIRRQFLVEATMLSLSGGLVGAALGALAAAGISVVFPATVRPPVHPLGARPGGHRGRRRRTRAVVAGGEEDAHRSAALRVGEPIMRRYLDIFRRGFWENVRFALEVHPRAQASRGAHRRSASSWA
mgnify:CR=1 FL=1